MKSAVRRIFLLCLIVSIAACATSTVVRREGGARVSPRVPSTPKYGATVIVQRGDTLYRIATDNRISPLDLAVWNSVPPPYTIYPGQRLRLYPGGARTTASTSPSRPMPPRTTRPSVSVPPPRITTPNPTSTPPPPAPVVVPATSNIAWRWPAEGQIVGRYVSGEPTKQGVDIAGQGGSPVRAAADGVVVYSGSGLVGYGELIIVKHDDTWLSAYGHNRERLINEGQRVQAGQQIALMGRSGAARDMLHFEIRYNGKPVDPLLYLPNR